MRWLFALAATIGVNLLLLLLMARLVEGGPPRIERDAAKALRIDLVQVRREPPPEPKSLLEPPPPPPQKAPPPPPEASVPQSRPRLIPQALPMPSMALPLRLGAGPFIGAYAPPAPPIAAPAAEADVTPLVRINPRYPRRALRAGIEGKVVVELTVQADGSVSDPEVISAEPANLFETSVLRAVKRWKFAPKIVDGEAVSRRVLQTVRFTLSKKR
jgi:protein TonB